MADFNGVTEPVAGNMPQQPQPRTLSADRGWHWIIDAFQLVRKQFGMWILLCLITFIVLAVANMVPLLGMVASTLLQPLLFAGLVFACSEIERGEELEIGQLFIGFQRNPAQLMLVGVIGFAATLGAMLVAAIPLLVLGGSSMAAALSGQDPTAMQALGGVGLIALLLFALVLLLLMVPVSMAMWFASALVLFHEMAAWPAFKLSFLACLRNVMPFFIFGLIAAVLCVVAALPFGLGLILLLPVLMATAYTSFRDVFGV